MKKIKLRINLVYSGDIATGNTRYGIVVYTRADHTYAADGAILLSVSNLLDYNEW